MLILNPSNDEDFRLAVEHFADDATSPNELQALLRHRYRRAIVRPRELSGEQLSVWYVYRDGKWVSGADMEVTDDGATA